jgi:hypothetical protein
LDLTAAAIRDYILFALPTRWKGSFKGIQPLLINGMSSSVLEKDTLHIINSLVLVENDLIVDKSENRVLTSVLANLPRLIHAYEEDPSSDDGSNVRLTLEECMKTAKNLSDLAHKSNHPSLARLLLSYSKQRFRTKGEFLTQIVNNFRDYFFPHSEAFVFQTLVNMLSNSLKFYKKSVLKCLKMLLPILTTKSQLDKPANLNSSNTYYGLINVESGLINPIMDLFHTDLVTLASDVLDQIMSGSISVSYIFLQKKMFLHCFHILKIF